MPPDTRRIRAARRYFAFELDRWLEPYRLARRLRMLEHPGDQRHPYRYARRRLLEIDRARIAVQFIGKFVGARQRMHHHRFLRAAGTQSARVKMTITRLRLFAPSETLALQSGHVKGVEERRRTRGRHAF